MTEPSLTTWPDLGYGVKIGHVDQEGWPFEMKRCEADGESVRWVFDTARLFPERKGAPDFEDGLRVAKGWIYKRRLLEFRVEDACFEGAEDLALFGAALLRLAELADRLRMGGT